MDYGLWLILVCFFAVVVMIFTILFTWITYRKQSLLPWMIVVALVAGDVFAQEEDDDIIILADKPIILDGQVMLSAGMSIDAALQQVVWWNNTLSWLNATVPLPQNVTA